MNPDRLARVLDAGRVCVGMTGDYRPFSWIEPDGLWAGLDVFLLHAVARDLGVDATFAQTSWPAMTADLFAGRFDVIAGGVSRSPDRDVAGLFGKTYLRDGKVALVRRADRARWTDLASFDTPATRIGVNPGGGNERFVRERIPRAALTMIEDNLAIPGLVASGAVDMMITDGIEAAYAARADTRLIVHEAAPPFLAIEKTFYYPKDAAGLRDRIDSALGALEAGGAMQALCAGFLPSGAPVDD